MRKIRRRRRFFHRLGFKIPPTDVPCILPGNKLDLQCFILNDPDAARIRTEEAGLFQEALAAAQSGILDPFHQVQTLGKLEIFDPNLSVNNNIACSYCHDPMAGYANGSSVLSIYTGAPTRARSRSQSRMPTQIIGSLSATRKPMFTRLTSRRCSTT